MQKLSKRLLAVADSVTEGSLAADIGTDHGFLPIYLIQSGKCPKVIAMDIKQGPLDRAREHIAAASLQNMISVRLSDGMRQLAKGEADSVIIAGMGGLTMLHILEEASDQLADFKELILEPQSDIAKVRKYLREHNWYIDQENLVYECGKFYPILHVCMRQTNTKPLSGSGESAMKKMLLEQLADQERFYAVLDRYGERMIFGNCPVFSQMLSRDEKKQRQILRQLEQASASEKQYHTKTALIRKKEVEMRLEEIQILRKAVNRINRR